MSDKVGADDFLKSGRRLEDLPTVELGLPELKDAALYGLPGRVVRALDPYTEASKTAVLLHFLAGVGNLIGAGPHATVNYDVHPLRLNVALVGATAAGRKGTSWSGPRHLLEAVDPVWAATRVKGGLSSGEGLIYHVRDPQTRQEPIKEKGRVVGYETVVVDAGEEDKRLLVIETEMASVLRRMMQESNSLSAVLRQAWDSGHLSTLTKNSPLRATNAHVSVLAHITPEEVQRYLSSTEMANGFGNRFLWAAVHRSKLLPDGGIPPRPLMEPLIIELKAVVKSAQSLGELERDSEARELWRTVYPQLSAGEETLAGKMLARGVAQVLRLSVVYAVLDKDLAVRPPHLRAALAIWDYCAASVRHIFAGRLGDPELDPLLQALTGREMSKTEIHGFFGRNRPVEDIDRELALLEARGLIERRIVPTPGRDREVWSRRPLRTNEETKEGSGGGLP